MNKNVPLYYNEDKTAFGVLVSYCYGAGFSTWAYHEMAYDRRVIEFWLSHKDDEQWMMDVRYHTEGRAFSETINFFTSIGYPDLYFGGFANCELEWVPIGTNFRINEYDGAESLEIEDGSNWW